MAISIIKKSSVEKEEGYALQGQKIQGKSAQNGTNTTKEVHYLLYKK